MSKEKAITYINRAKEQLSGDSLIVLEIVGNTILRK